MSLPIEKAILTLTKDAEIDNCLRGVFWDLCIQLPSWRRHHNEIFADIVHRIQDGGRTLRQVMEEQDGHVMIRAITIEGRWVARMKELHRNAIVREENYDIVDGVATLKWWGQFSSCEDAPTIRPMKPTGRNFSIAGNAMSWPIRSGRHWETPLMSDGRERQ